MMAMTGYDQFCPQCVEIHGPCSKHYGRSPRQETPVVRGLKDLTKPPVYTGLIANFPHTLLELAALSAHGVSSVPGRTPLDWHHVPNPIAAYSDAAMRHILARQIDVSGLDPQSKYPHLTHAIWSWCAVRELEIILDRNPGNVV